MSDLDPDLIRADADAAAYAVSHAATCVAAARTASAEDIEANRWAEEESER